MSRSRLRVICHVYVMSPLLCHMPCLRYCDLSCQVTESSQRGVKDRAQKLSREKKHARVVTANRKDGPNNSFKVKQKRRDGESENIKHPGGR